MDTTNADRSDNNSLQRQVERKRVFNTLNAEELINNSSRLLDSVKPINNASSKEGKAESYDF